MHMSTKIQTRYMIYNNSSIYIHQPNYAISICNYTNHHVLLIYLLIQGLSQSQSTSPSSCYSFQVSSLSGFPSPSHHPKSAAHITLPSPHPQTIHPHPLLLLTHLHLLPIKSQ
jgi:hypothetical protein